VELAAQSDHEADVYAVAFNPGGRYLATAGYDRLIHLRESECGESLKVLHGHVDWVFAVAFSEDGETLASGSGDGTIRFWDVATGECTRTHRRQRTVSGLSFHEHLLASTAPSTCGTGRPACWRASCVRQRAARGRMSR